MIEPMDNEVRIVKTELNNGSTWYTLEYYDAKAEYNSYKHKWSGLWRRHTYNVYHTLQEAEAVAARFKGNLVNKKTIIAC